MIRFLSSVAALILMAGCATTEQQGSQASPQPPKLGACVAAIKSIDLIALEVPSSKNSISNKMAAAAVKMGGSSTVDTLVKFLSQPKRPALAVVGESDELTAATLLAALSKLDSVPGRSRSPVCFVGDASYAGQLKPVAESVGLTLFVVPR